MSGDPVRQQVKAQALEVKQTALSIKIISSFMAEKAKIIMKKSSIQSLY